MYLLPSIRPPTFRRSATITRGGHSGIITRGIVVSPAEKEPRIRRHSKPTVVEANIRFAWPVTRYLGAR